LTQIGARASLPARSRDSRERELFLIQVSTGESSSRLFSLCSNARRAEMPALQLERILNFLEQISIKGKTMAVGNVGAGLVPAQ
jgi:hypothetical protein